MRKLISFTHMSLDGFIGGPNGEMEWIVYDDELVANARALTDKTGAAIYGRTTYEMMYSYWPTVFTSSEATPEELYHAKWVENIPKFVFSTTLEKATWNNTTLIRDNIAEHINKLKEQPGDDMVIFGSPRLTHSLARLGLIDLYRTNINPIAIGRGMPLFEPGQPQATLKLVESTIFGNGVIGALYEVVR
jgi:dihydrofolate reductase